MRIEGVTKKLIQKTEDKFRAWDEVVKNNTLETGTKEEIARAYLLLKDPTIYFYAWFKDPRDPTKPFKFYPYQDIIINDSGKRIAFAAANQIGKGQPLSTAIFTINGSKTFKDLKIGDEVFGSEGKPTKIINFPYEGMRPCYNVTFDDESSTIVSKEHLWKCKTSKQRFRKKYIIGRGKKKGQEFENKEYNQWITLSTEDILEKGRYNPTTNPYNKVSIPICKAVNYPIQELKVNPYILGLLLGDGCFTNYSYCSGDKELILEMSKYFRKNYFLDFNDRYNLYIPRIQIKSFLEKFNLLDKKSDTKFIPEQYKLASIEQRKALLRGLMDTDGSVYGKYSTLEYCTVSKQLKEDFVELINSLGGVVNKVTIKKPFYYDKNRDKVKGKDAYSIRFKINFNPFKLKRKADNWKPVTKYRHERLIEKIEYVGWKKTRCIEVDNEDHTYCSDKSYIVTHNSITLCAKAIVFALHNSGTTTLMVSRTLPQSKDLLLQIKNFLRNSSLDYQEDLGDTETKTEIYFRHYVPVEEYDEELGRVITKKKELPQSRIICVPATEAALGYAVDLALVDELAFYEDGDYFYNQILQPRTYTTKGQIIVFSNPNGQQGIFWNLWNDKHFNTYRFNFLDCPTNTLEEFDRIAKGLTRERIDSTLQAEFTDPEGGFLTLQERKDMQQDRPNILPSIITQPVYIFFDWAKSIDRTVRIIGVPIRNNKDDWADEVYVYEMKEYTKDTPYTEIIDVDLKNLVHEIGLKNVAMVGWDNTGVGKGLEDFVNRINQLGIMTMPVEFSGQNKSRIYTLFKLLAEQKRIKVPRVDDCDKQLSSLRFKKSTRGYLMVHHENEKDRDDYPDALAGICSLMISPDSPPITCEII